jgi:ribosomal protein S18 acetylase RimI-like enzyme
VGTAMRPHGRIEHMDIRVATVEDAPVIAGLGVAIQRMHHDERPDWFKPADETAGTELYGELLRDPAVTVYLAEESEALGFVVVKLHHRPDSALGLGQTLLELDQIGVAPSARRRGVGHALMNAVRERADEVSAKRIILTTWEFNVDAHRFFEGEGLSTELRRMSMPWPSL